MLLRISSAYVFPLSTVPAVEFASKINNVKALEQKEASFQCVLSTPLNSITWSTPDSSLEHGDKYDISVSEDKLIHTLTIKNCDVADNGTYYAIAGTASCNASLAVEGRTEIRDVLITFIWTQICVESLDR